MQSREERSHLRAESGSRASTATEQSWCRGEAGRASTSSLIVRSCSQGEVGRKGGRSLSVRSFSRSEAGRASSTTLASSGQSGSGAALKSSCSRTSCASTRSRRSSSGEPGQAGPRLSPRDQIVCRQPCQVDGLDSTVRVAVRFRPLAADEEQDASVFVVRPDGHTVDSSDLAYSFEFDHSFGGDASQAQVYDAIGYATVKDVLDGYNGTILAYGQTGSGKTHCMFGSDLLHRNQQGIVPRSARQIFSSILAGPSDARFVLRCSLLELYCEQLRDLLNPSNRQLKVQESAQRGVHVEGLTEECVTCEEEVTEILQMGLHMRAVACTRMNQMSSRSHMLFFLSIEHRLPDGSERSAKLSLVDLAGSERVDRSGALSAGGVMLKEAKTINCSLSALGHTIQALSEQRPHVPYRNSQLTRVLQDTLGGNCKTTLLVACSPAAGHVSDTLSSLRFAARARSVCNHVKVNLIHSPEQLTCLVGQLQRELHALRREAARLGGGSGRRRGTSPIPAEEDAANGKIDDWQEKAGVHERAPEANPPATQVANPEAAAAEVDRLIAELKERDVYAAAARDSLLATAKAAASAAAAQVAMQAQSSPASREQLPCSSLGVRVAAAKLLSLVERDGGLEWQSAVAQYGASVAEVDVQQWEATAKGKEEELEEALARLRTQRLLLRRQEAHGKVPAAGVGESQGDVSSATATGLETSSMSGRGSRARLRAQRSYLSCSQKGSKILRPISKRDVEQLSGTSASSATSSFCDCSSFTTQSPPTDSAPRDDPEDGLADRPSMHSIDQVTVDGLVPQLFDVRQSLLLPRGLIASPPIPAIPPALMASPCAQGDSCSGSVSTCDTRTGYCAGSKLSLSQGSVAVVPGFSAEPFRKSSSEPMSVVSANLAAPSAVALNSSPVDSCSRTTYCAGVGVQQPALVAFPVRMPEPSFGTCAGPLYRQVHRQPQVLQKPQVTPATPFARYEAGSALGNGYCVNKSPALMATPVPADATSMPIATHSLSQSASSGDAQAGNRSRSASFSGVPSSNVESTPLRSSSTAPLPQLAVPAMSVSASGSNASATHCSQGRVVIWSPAAADVAGATSESFLPAQSREGQLLMEIERQKREHDAWRRDQLEQDQLRQEDFDRHVEEVQKIFRAAQNAQMCSDAETLHVREQLAQLDESIDEAVSAGDAAEVKILRLQRQIDSKQLELDAIVEPMLGVDTEDFEFCLSQVWQTMGAMQKNLAQTSDGSCGKENEKPATESAFYRKVRAVDGEVPAVDTACALRSVLTCSSRKVINVPGRD